ncbi:MAG: 30S ribosomal protein S17 [Gammaproteobacteria bacterium]|nr:30S ribosomal protein S17 [Gammaproteobacteria bacterium]
MSEQAKNVRTVTGKVVSDKMQKTIVVLVERSVRHPKYEKIIKRRTKLHAHDENCAAKIGQMVRIQECRPISKTKTWKLVEIL